MSLIIGGSDIRSLCVLLAENGELCHLGPLLGKVVLYSADWLCGIARNDHPGRDVLSDDAACAHNRPIPHSDTGHDDGMRANENIVAYVREGYLGVSKRELRARVMGEHMYARCECDVIPNGMRQQCE